MDTHDWRSELRRRLGALPVNPAGLEDLIEELAEHLERAEFDLRARGYRAADARETLRNELDDTRLRALAERRARPRPPSALAVGTSELPMAAAHLSAEHRAAGALRDLRFAFRALLRDWKLAAFIITALGLGMGANAAMFSVLDRLLLRGPLHVHNAHELRRIVSTTRPTDRPSQRTGYLTYAQYEAFRTDTRTFTDVAAYNLLTGTMYGVRGNARSVHRGSATGNFFTLLGVRAALGRFFTEAEDNPDAPQRVVVLGYGFWQSEFGGDSSILGRVIPLDYSNYTVIGVAPKGFTGIDLARVDAWVPESGVPHSTGWRTIWYWPWLHVVARVRPGVSVTQANDALTRLHRLGYQGRSEVARNATITAEPIHYTYAGVEGNETRVSRWLFGVSAAVLLIACANVVNLLLVRTARRRREIAVRLALGAGRFRIIRLLVLEAFLLCIAGGAAAVAVAYALGTQARTLLPDIDWPMAPLDPRLLLATVGLALFCALLVGAAPAVQGSSAHPGDALRSGVREGGGRTAGFRSALVIAQAALSIVLLIAAGLFVQSFRRTLALNPGLETNRLITFKVDHMWLGIDRNDTLAIKREVARRDAFYPMMVERLAAWPEIEAVALASNLPFVDVDEYPIRLPGRDSIPALQGGGPFVATVSPEYFTAVETPILQGRAFTLDDRAGNAPVVIVNETAARVLWPDRSALGQCLIVADAERCAAVVGVAVDTRRSFLREDPAIQVYVPRAQQRIGGEPLLIVHAHSDIGRVTSRVRAELLRLDPSIRYVYVDFPHDEVARQARPWQLGTAIFTVFGALALVVAAVGLYSVMAYVVAQRTQEIGVRMALGAEPRDIAWLTLSGGLTLVGSGIVIGLVLAFVGGRKLAPLLYETSPTDPLIYSGAIIAMTSVAAIAALIPTLRARRIDPVEALRLE
jgi:predicted permease